MVRETDEPNPLVGLFDADGLSGDHLRDWSSAGWSRCDRGSWRWRPGSLRPTSRPGRCLAAAEEQPTMQWRRRALQQWHRGNGARHWRHWRANAQYRQSRRDRADSSALSGPCGLFRYERAWRHPPRISPQPALSDFILSLKVWHAKYKAHGSPASFQGRPQGRTTWSR